MTVRVTGDEVEVDLTGSADQTPTAYNVPFEGSTKVAAYAAFRKLLLDAGDLGRARALERGLVPAGQGDGAARVDLQPARRRPRPRRVSPNATG